MTVQRRVEEAHAEIRNAGMRSGRTSDHDDAIRTIITHAQHGDIGLADGEWCPVDGNIYPCEHLRAVLDLYAPEVS